MYAQGQRSDRVCCAPQMGFDGPLSAQEQMYILYEIKMQCYQNLSNTEPGTTGTNHTRRYSRHFKLYDGGKIRTIPKIMESILLIKHLFPTVSKQGKLKQKEINI